MPVEYQTLTFEDTNSGRAKMNRTIQQMATQGWRVHSKETSQQGYDAGKTCCLGCLFLPLALLGKSNNKITVIFERDMQEVVTPEVAVQQPASPTPATTTTAKAKSNVTQHKATIAKKTTAKPKKAQSTNKTNKSK